jgi:transcriptional regulator with XRE-family HTH domain
MLESNILRPTTREALWPVPLEMPETTVNVDALYAALDTKRRSQESSWREIARDLDVSPSTFSRMAHGRRPDVDTFATLLRWLNVDAEAFMTGGEGHQEEKPNPMVMVSTYLRSAKNIDDAEAKALEDIFEAAYNRLVTSKD